MTIAVVAVDALFRMRGDLLEKERVIRQMGSRNNHLALDAARTVIERGWHRDGSLAGICFDRADLRDLTMSSARLAGSSFMYAGLRDAELMFANLRSARLGSSDLRSANLSFSDLESGCWASPIWRMLAWGAARAMRTWKGPTCVTPS